MDSNKELNESPARRLAGKPLNRTIRSTLSVLAAVLLIAVGYFAYNFYTLSWSKIYSSYFHPYKLKHESKDSITIESPLVKAYREKKYRLVSELGKKHQSTPEMFLTGMSILELGNMDKAIENFKAVIATGDPAWKEEAEYYLALAYIRNRDYDLALTILHSIIDNKGHKYFKETDARLIRQVKMLKWR